MKSALLVALTLAIYSHNSLASWETPFNEAINRLKLGNQETHSSTVANFVKNADAAWSTLKKSEKDWKNLLNPNDKIEALIAPRQAFEAKEYIAKVFPTKGGTLIFQMSKYPTIIVKIDNREDASFTKVYRSYLSAMEKSQKVQKEAAPGKFSPISSV